MQILSINEEHTKANNQIALNVDAPLTPGVMARVEKYGILHLHLEGSILHCSWHNDLNGAHEPITAKTIEGLNKTFAAAQKVYDDEAATLARKRDALMRQLAQQTGLPVA